MTADACMTTVRRCDCNRIAVADQDLADGYRFLLVFDGVDITS